MICVDFVSFCRNICVHIKLLLTYWVSCRSSAFLFLLDCWNLANVTEGTAFFILQFSFVSKRRKVREHLRMNM